MSKFHYTAITKTGEKRKGEIESVSKDQVADLLRSKGLVPVNIDVEGGISFADLSETNIGGVPMNEKVVFMRQLATMVGAGLPLTQSLEILRAQAQNKAFQVALKDVVNGVRGGMGLADAMAKQKGVFDEITINLVRAGEESGALEEIFNRLADNMEEQREFQSKVRGAMIYPIVVVIAMIGVVIVLLTTMVPQMKELYDDFDSVLPLPTRILVSLSDVLLKYWWLLLTITVIAIASFISYRRSKAGKIAIDNLMLKIPVFGKLSQDIQVAEFARTFEMLMRSGMPIVQSLEIVSNSLGNEVYKAAIRKTAKAVEKGVPLAKPISEEEYFPTIVSQMIAVGEETGKVDVILGKLDDYYSQEVSHTVSNLTSLMEPFILVVMGGLIGFLAIAIYLPIFNLGDVIG